MSSEVSNEDKKNASNMYEIQEKKESRISQKSSSKNNNKEDIDIKSSQSIENNNKLNINNDNESYVTEEDEESEEEEDEEQDEFEEEFMEAFNRLDEDHSGTITKEELFNFMRKLGYRPSDLELREMMEEVSKEHPGQITYNEFKYILSKPIKDELTVNSTIEAFSVFDKMMKGKIKKEDLKNILLTRGEQNMTEEEIQDLLDHYVEFDENGEVDYKNFVKKTFEIFK
jgi:Ca2+-binding EF-hand superfamily protein